MLLSRVAIRGILYVVGRLTPEDFTPVDVEGMARAAQRPDAADEPPPALPEPLPASAASLDAFSRATAKAAPTPSLYACLPSRRAITAAAADAWMALLHAHHRSRQPDTHGRPAVALLGPSAAGELLRSSTGAPRWPVLATRLSILLFAPAGTADSWVVATVAPVLPAGAAGAAAHLPLAVHVALHDVRPAGQQHAAIHERLRTCLLAAHAAGAASPGHLAVVPAAHTCFAAGCANKDAGVAALAAARRLAAGAVCEFDVAQLKRGARAAILQPLMAGALVELLPEERTRGVGAPARGLDRVAPPTAPAAPHAAQRTPVPSAAARPRPAVQAARPAVQAASTWALRPAADAAAAYDDVAAQQATAWGAAMQALRIAQEADPRAPPPDAYAVGALGPLGLGRGMEVTDSAITRYFALLQHQVHSDAAVRFMSAAVAKAWLLAPPGGAISQEVIVEHAVLHTPLTLLAVHTGQMDERYGAQLGGGHWILVAVQVGASDSGDCVATATVFDSLATATGASLVHTTIAAHIGAHLQAAAYPHPLPFSWEVSPHAVQQQDGCSCGLLAIFHARYIAAQAPFAFTAPDVAAHGRAVLHAALTSGALGVRLPSEAP